MRTAALTLALLLTASLANSAEYPPPAVPDISQRPHPRIAATGAELDRLRAAYEGTDKAARQVVAEIVKEADAALKRPVEFPPSRRPAQSVVPVRRLPDRAQDRGRHPSQVPQMLESLFGRALR